MNASTQATRNSFCALFDLALLKVYEDAAFFHFTFHDGVLEALDNRKKEALLKIVREQIASGKTQYILTLIEADMPRDAKGSLANRLLESAASDLAQADAE